MTTVLSYDQNEGVKAGGGDFVTEGGPYVCQITEAKFTKAGTGTLGMEFSIKTKEGLSARFISVYYKKADGELVKGGHSLLQAMMGILNIRELTVVRGNDNEDHCPEFEGKKLGLFLQKKLYTKNDQTDGYKFEIAVPFNPADRRTLRETVENKEAKTIERMEASYSDKDERGQNPQAGGYSQSYGGQQGYPEATQGTGGFNPIDEDIPW